MNSYNEGINKIVLWRYHNKPKIYIISMVDAIFIDRDSPVYRNNNIDIIQVLYCLRLYVHQEPHKLFVQLYYAKQF